MRMRNQHIKHRTLLKMELELRSEFLMAVGLVNGKRHVAI